MPNLLELGFLSALPDLKVLWLSHNPIAADAKYRATTIRTLPGLQKLDDSSVTDVRSAAFFFFTVAKG